MGSELMANSVICPLIKLHAYCHWHFVFVQVCVWGAVGDILHVPEIGQSFKWEEMR